MFCCLGGNINHGWKLGILRIWWNRPTKHRNDDKDHNSGIHQHSFFFIYSQSSFTKIQIELMIWYILHTCDGTYIYSFYIYANLIILEHIWGDPAWQPEEEEFHQRGETDRAVATSRYLIFCSSLCVQRKRNKWSLNKCVCCQFCLFSVALALFLCSRTLKVRE